MYQWKYICYLRSSPHRSPPSATAALLSPIFSLRVPSCFASLGFLRLFYNLCLSVVAQSLEKVAARPGHFSTTAFAANVKGVEL